MELSDSNLNSYGNSGRFFRGNRTVLSFLNTEKNEN